MVLETLPPSFWQWFPSAVMAWLGVVILFGGIAAVVALILTVMRHGPEAPLALAQGVKSAVTDLLFISPRRVFALARLAVYESIHRRVLVAFAVFILVLLFAGWYLDSGSRDLSRLYLSFVMTTTSYLVLILALFLSVFSLPTDIAQRTIHTIVTKPVRTTEIILGRILGFVATCTALLVVTGVISYVFVVRGLEHTHEIEVESLEAEADPGNVENPVVQRGKTTREQGHQHEVLVYADGTVQLTESQGHDHAAEATDASGTQFRVGSPRGMLTARVPIYGQLQFFDRNGAASTKGVSVGDEWEYRSFIPGGTLAAAVWRFEGVTPKLFPEGLPVEMTIGVFRTHKGDIERSVQGALRVRNPRTGLTSASRFFSAREFYVGSEFIPRKLLDAEGRTLDLFDDLVENGMVEIELKCLDREQYFGMAQADLYLRATEASFAMNFAKGYVGIWLQMVLVVTVGVMFSTFLNGSVAMLATVATLLGGFFTNFIRELASGDQLGGGPTESLVRLVQQSNMIVDLNPGAATNVIKFSDRVFQFVLGGVAAVLPDFGRLSDVDYVANGYDIPWRLLMVHGFTALGFLLPVFLAGYFFFKSREVAR